MELRIVDPPGISDIVMRCDEFEIADRSWLVGRGGFSNLKRVLGRPGAAAPAPAPGRARVSPAGCS